MSHHNTLLLGLEVESESDDSSSESESYTGPSRMTQRQAALAGVVEKTDLISLGMWMKDLTRKYNLSAHAMMTRGACVKEEKAP